MGYGSGVQYVRHRPGPPLDQFVEYLWALRDSPVHSWERIVPSGTLELVINLVEDEVRVYRPESAQARRYPGAVVSGAFAGYFVIDTREHASIVGVHFRPGGAHPFLASPADRLADRHVALHDLWAPGEVARLRDRLCSVAAARRFAVLEEALMARLRWPRESERVVGVALAQMTAGASVADVASAVGLSHRRFIEIFGRVVGMRPKLFMRVERFQRLLALAGRDDGPRWASLAHRSGYYDQSHLIRDFHSFAGLTPGELLQQRGGRVKDHHLVEGSNLSKTGFPRAPMLG